MRAARRRNSGRESDEKGKKVTFTKDGMTHIEEALKKL